MACKIPDNSTIPENWHRFTRPKEYVAGVRHKMMKCCKENGNSSVKIGITGTGQKPCFRITYVDGGGEEKIYGSYWDNMEPLSNETAASENWSTRASTFDEIDTFLKSKVKKAD